MSELIQYLSNHRRPVSAVLADIALTLMLAASLGRARSATVGSSQYWVAIMFAICFISTTCVVRIVWGFFMRRLKQWNQNHYIYLHPQPIEPDAAYYAFQIVLCYGLLVIGFIVAAFVLAWTEERLIDAYVIGTFMLAIAAIIAFCVGAHRLYVIKRSL